MQMEQGARHLRLRNRHVLRMGEPAGSTLVDTPGHEDFSEDTYRTLTAVDAAVMVIDGAKGVESQTRKLFEVCRLRDMPILTFCNKMDRESRDIFEIIDEIQENLAIDVTPASLVADRRRQGVSRLLTILFHDRLQLLDRADRNKVATEGEQMDGLDDPRLAERLPADKLEQLREEVEMARGLLPAFDRVAFLDGTLTPIWFGSALNSFGVRELLEGAGEYAPPPRARATAGSHRRAELRRRSPASSLKFRPIWTRSTATASPSSASAPGISNAA